MSSDNLRSKCEKMLAQNGFDLNVAGVDDYQGALKAYMQCAEIIMPRRYGIIVTGKAGCGKTCLINAITKTAHVLTRTFTLSDTRHVHTLSEMLDDSDWCKQLPLRNIFLDDVGAENLINEFGVKRDIVGEVIDLYYREGRERLFITTNLSGEELLKRYGERILDRIKSLCVPLVFSGNSKRNWIGGVK